MHPIQLLRPPDKVLRESDLFDNGWEAKSIDARGVQAYTELLTSGQTDGRGLRVTATRTTGVGDAGNAFTVEIAGGGPLALTWDEDEGILGGTLANGTGMTALKNAIDALTDTPFTTAFVGSESGSGPTPNAGYSQPFANGTRDRWAWFVLKNTSTTQGLVVTGQATPTVNTAAEECIRGENVERVLGRGDLIYTNRTGTSDLAGSISMWVLDEGELERGVV